MLFTLFNMFFLILEGKGRAGAGLGGPEVEMGPGGGEGRDWAGAASGKAVGCSLKPKPTVGIFCRVSVSTDRIWPWRCLVFRKLSDIGFSDHIRDFFGFMFCRMQNITFGSLLSSGFFRI